eukprot:TRINITY_DN2001_c0_g3_i1.p1 TRINITY_DN2001_c0_g3~~TRINITY_DN2001_c0_g3_i1.p1  ORF type:complete len:326 (-),score=-54.87 TRINITY_DN2001_c0_g3_i1:412-1389(-)
MFGPIIYYLSDGTFLKVFKFTDNVLWHGHDPQLYHGGDSSLAPHFNKPPERTFSLLSRSVVLWECPHPNMAWLVSRANQRGELLYGVFACFFLSPLWNLKACFQLFFGVGGLGGVPSHRAPTRSGKRLNWALILRDPLCTATLGGPLERLSPKRRKFVMESIFLVAGAGAGGVVWCGYSEQEKAVSISRSHRPACISVAPTLCMREKRGDAGGLGRVEECRSHFPLPLQDMCKLRRNGLSCPHGVSFGIRSRKAGEKSSGTSTKPNGSWGPHVPELYDQWRLGEQHGQHMAFRLGKSFFFDSPKSKGSPACVVICCFRFMFLCCL